ncbi:MAG: hypothetical protein AB7O78_16720, partial [Thermoleophilia bacterium]
MTQLRSVPRLAWLGALLAALLVAMLAPALARADEGTAGGTAVAEQPADTASDTTATTSDAPADTSAPADEATPADGAAAPEGSAATDPAAPPSEGTTAEAPAPSPTAPPSAGEVDLPGIALLPAGELAPTEAPSPPGEALATTAPSLPEMVPLIAAPEAPRATRVVPAVDVPAALPDGPTGALVPTRAGQAVTVGAGVLGGPPDLRTAAPVTAATHAAADGAATIVVAAMPLRAGAFPLDPGVTASGGRERALGPATTAFGAGDATAQIAAPRLVAPGGPAPSQSLLAVLASYILPGSGPVPAGT